MVARDGQHSGSWMKNCENLAQRGSVPRWGISSMESARWSSVSTTRMFGWGGCATTTDGDEPEAAGELASRTEVEQAAASMHATATRATIGRLDVVSRAVRSSVVVDALT